MAAKPGAISRRQRRPAGIWSTAVWRCCDHTRQRAELTTTTGCSRRRICRPRERQGDHKRINRYVSRMSLALCRADWHRTTTGGGYAKRRPIDLMWTAVWRWIIQLHGRSRAARAIAINRQRRANLQSMQFWHRWRCANDGYANKHFRRDAEICR